MKSIFDSFVKWIFILLALSAGFVFVLKTFLNPPKASVPIASDPTASAPIASNPESPQQLSPSNKESNSNNSLEETSKSNNLEISNSNKSQSLETSSIAEPELVNNSQSQKNNIPTTKQPKEYVLEIPPKLEEGAELKIFVNNDDSANPNPANYSPSKIIKTKNIVLSPGARDDVFQESTGYFKVEKAGEYNFLIEHSGDRYYDDGRLVGKIDQEPLGNPKGGRMELDRGWHRLDLFYNPQNYARRIDEREVSVKMGRPGEIAETIDIWRAVKAEETAQKLETK